MTPALGQDGAASELRVHACGPEDRARQAALFNACFKKRVDAAALAWRYDRSPHGASLSFLTVDDRGGEAGVSGYACSPRRMLAFGDEKTMATVGETGDVMTHPDWRKRGLFSALDRACVARAKELGWPVLFGLPNRRSAHLFVELGWKEVGTIRPWNAVLRADRGARAVLGVDGRVSAMLAPIHSARTSAARRALRRSAGGRFRVRELDAFPPEVQELSRAEEQRFALMARRDRAWLEWRFLKTPSKLHRALGVFDETGDLRGYAVVQLPRPGEARGWVSDLLVRGDEARAAAFEGALTALADAGASVASAHAVDGSRWGAALAGAGFRPSGARQELAVIAWIADPEHPLARAALRAADWHLTDGDRDDETVG